jgi:hypothetical protein
MQTIPVWQQIIAVIFILLLTFGILRIFGYILSNFAKYILDGKELNQLKKHNNCDPLNTEIVDIKRFYIKFHCKECDKEWTEYDFTNTDYE